MASICLLIAIILFSDTASVTKTTTQINNQQVPVYFHIGGLLMLVHIFYYLFKSKNEIKKVLSQVKNMYSNVNQGNFKLLKFVLNSFIVLFSLSLIHSILPFMGVKRGLLFTLLAMIVFMFYFINSILLKMLNQSNEGGEITQVNFKTKEKYAGSNLSQTDLKIFIDTLENHMKTNKRFLDGDLTINDLSTELNISTKILSQVINEGFVCNFFDFVNIYRVNEAKSIFKNLSDKKMTIQEVMYNSGFNSKSSFNTAFKKFTSQTPT